MPQNISRSLTLKQAQIFALRVQGYTIKECADILGITYHAAVDRLTKIYKKLEARNMAEAITHAIENGTITQHIHSNNSLVYAYKDGETLEAYSP